MGQKKAQKISDPFAHLTALAAAHIRNAAKTVWDAKISVSPELIEIPPQPELGDCAFPCFSLAKELKTAPAVIAQKIAEVSPKASEIPLTVAAAGPYVNFFFDPRALASILLKSDTESLCGLGDGKKERVCIEYVSPNTNKPLHLGHVRNAVLGDAVARILECAGNDVVRTSLVNDRGIHICKSMVAYARIRGLNGKVAPGYEDPGADPKTAGKKGDHLVGDYYVLYEKILKDDSSIEECAQECLRQWEAGEKKTRAVWKKMNHWVLAGMASTYARLGVSFDKTYFESEIYLEGKSIILSALKKGRVRRDDTGAVIADLAEFGLPEKVLLRRDGTTLYITQDIYLAVQKKKDFSFDSSLYVVGSEQNLYLKQLFAVLKKIGYGWAERLTHLSYGMVNLPEGKMKSREGTVVDADDILDELERLAAEEITQRDPDLGKREVEKRKRAIALAALKFYMLDVSPSSDMTFNPKESIAFQGRTGPYLLYTYARIASILRKAPHRSAAPSATPSDYDWAPEKQLLLLLSRFPSAAKRAAAEYAPSHVAAHMYALAKALNDYYHSTQVLSGAPDVRDDRLRLLRTVADTLKTGLGLLGIQTIEKM